MKIFKYLITWIIIITIASPIVFALTSSQAGKILDNFKKLEKEMIFESDAILLDDGDKNILQSYKKLNIYGNIGDRVQLKRKYLEAQNKKIISRVGSLQNSIEQLDKDVADLTQEVQSINQRIVIVKGHIGKNKETIKLLKTKISESTKTLLKYMVYLYKKGEFVSSKNDIDNLKTILLSGERIDELINDLYFTSVIQITGQQLVAKHRKYISTLYIKKLELQKDEKDLKQLRKKGIIEKNILDDKRASKKRLLEITKGQEKLYAKYIADKLEIERDVKIKELREQIRVNNTKDRLLEKYNCKFVEIGKEESELSGLTQQCIGINKIIFAESRLTGLTIGNNPFSWPITPYLGISSFFRDEEYKEQFDTDHDAIDIITPQGTEIKSPMDGYVIYLQKPTNTGYAYIALKHSDGLVSLYGHISESKVEQYDFIKAGEVFALTGGEYGTLGAGILTTGPHLHFVVYEDEQYNDPLEYLDTSYLRFSNLPEKYKYKYLSDFKARKGYEYTNARKTGGGNVFVIKGDTEVERQKYLLDTYAVGPFQNWDVWIEESVAGGIDPTFMMCVGLAETGLGKHLKTAYNIGNVGNTDSGSTYSFANAREGVYWMIQTFNNKYLSQYTEIQELSRYGNKDDKKPIYASSPFNWHNNITKCMSHVKGLYISDDYPFRINGE